MEFVDLSHVIEPGTVTYPGLPGPDISSHLSFDASRAHYAAGTGVHHRPHRHGHQHRHLAERGAALIGIDSINIDDTRTGERPAHTALLAAGTPIVEHLTGLDALPVTGARFTAVPPAVRGLGTFPVRAFAVVP